MDSHPTGMDAEKVGGLFGLAQSVVSRIIQNMDSNILNICQQFYDKKNFY